ncbi:hypothetical protein IGB42_03363 [Andreprevotia sp. IGB-42]|uniref:SRPBCC family protein n=1 Tax=Andreprevotia sp. IGB-42 TaxID=2497473 RepID=UPI00135B5876|nr:SRPBCC family protein [Andreprevotia sp. IGB-42]KAF0812086.1 hypothetical protein IGB42_03363 [Andreprevotia sp. IGB-42]
MTTVTETDRIERSIVINAPRTRVWQALSHAETFGTWFGARLDGQAFAPGQRTRGQISACGFENVFFDVVIERIEPEHLMSYHWHPFPVDPTVDYEQEHPTHVVFTLRDAPGEATLLKVVESGFDRVPLHRRQEAFRMNNHGWVGQLGNIDRYVTSQQ